MAEKRNVYVCQKCRGHTVTVDRHEGVTPFMIECRVGGMKPDLERCDGMMHSRFYRDPLAYLSVPEWEWFRPTDAELDEYVKHIDPRAEVGTRKHVAMGGLLLRRARSEEVLGDG